MEKNPITSKKAAKITLGYIPAFSEALIKSPVDRLCLQ